jgi:hypothetical protein
MSSSRLLGCLQVVSPETDDFDWLFSDAARPYLTRAADESRSLVSRTRSLRRELGANRARLAIDQAQLRRRARAKFTRAERLFFAARLLEQATDEWIARYKATRFPADASVADLCCGLGGDLMALAQRGPTVGIDRDAMATRLAIANCRALDRPHGRGETTDVTAFDIRRCDAWHIDPDRRAGGGRTTRLDRYAPGIEVLEQLLRWHDTAAIKLAPATVAPPGWQQRCELEWIGSRRECRQQVAWFGALARRLGHRTATVVAETGETVSFSGLPNLRRPAAPEVESYVFEPHAAVFAANLVTALAEQHGLLPLAEAPSYLTGDQRLTSPLLSAFEVLEVLPLDKKQLRAALRARRIGHLEVKVRGMRLDPQAWQRAVRVPGDGSATVLIADTGTKRLAILARRLLSRVATPQRICGGNDGVLE